MPFRLMNALEAFTKLMNQLFKPYLDTFAVVFVDDILIYFKSKEKHEQYLQMALQLLRSHQLYSKLSKCDFWLQQVAFLGHVISKSGIAVDPTKIEPIVSWPRP